MAGSGELSSWQTALQLLRDVQHHVNSDVQRVSREMAETISACRGDYHRLQEEQTALQRRVKLLNEQWTLGSRGGYSSQDEVLGKVGELQDSATRCSEEVERLRLSLFDDRLLREERQRAMESEDEALEQRLRRVEASNDALRVQVAALFTAAKETVVPSATHHRSTESDATISGLPLFRLDELEALAAEAEASFGKVQLEHATLQAKVESIERYVEQEEGARRKRLESIQDTIDQLARDQAAKKEARTRLPFQSGLSSFPTVGNAVTDKAKLSASSPVDVSLDWLNERRTQHGTALVAAVSPIVSEKGKLRQRLAMFYTVHNPAKLASLDAIMEEYDGAEAELMAALEMHYGCFGYFSSI